MLCLRRACLSISAWAAYPASWNSLQYFSFGGRDADRRCTASCRALPYAFSACLAGGSVEEPAWSPSVGLEAFMLTQIFYDDSAPLCGAPPGC